MARLADAVLDLGRIGWPSTASRACRGSSRRSAGSATIRFRPAQTSARSTKSCATPLLAAGYVEIGLDHFALPDDALARAAADGTLHRNFMGYTIAHHGAPRAGRERDLRDADCYHQNEKVITVYDRRVRDGDMPTLRGHLLSDDDRRRADGSSR